MISEKGILAVGVEYGGNVHKEFEIRPLLLGDSLAIGDDERAEDATYAGLLVLTRQLSIGAIPKEEITPELLKAHMAKIDFDIVIEKQGVLEVRLTGFRESAQGKEAEGHRPNEDGIQVPGSDGDVGD